MKLISAVRRLTVLAAALSLSAAAAMTSFASTRLDTVADTYWDDDDKTVATWEEVEEAYRYEVYLYCDESKVAEIKTKKAKYNFEKKMTKAGDYTFRVRALAKGSDYRDGAWSDYSDTMYIDEDFAELMKNGGVIDTKNSGPGAQNNGSSTSTVIDEASVVYTAGWIQDATGWWYRNTDGTYPANGWWQDPGTSVWYFFNDQGYMLTGWIDWNGQRYYCETSGAMVTGTQTIDGATYQFDASGALQQ